MVCKVQEWSYLFQDCRGFQDTYIALQKQGLEFPPPTRELMEEQGRLNAHRIDVEAARKRLADPLRKLKVAAACLFLLFFLLLANISLGFCDFVASQCAACH